MSTSGQADIIFMLGWRDMSNVYKWTGGHHLHAGVEGHVQCLQVDRRTSSSCWSGGTCPMSTSRQAGIILMLEWRDMSNVYKWTGGHHPHAGVEGHVQCLQVDRRTSSSCWSGGTCPMSTSRQADIILMLEWRDMSNVYKWTGGHHPHAGVEGHVQCLQVDRRTSSSCWSGGTCPMSTSRQAGIILMLEWRDMSNVYKWTGGHHPHAGVEGHVQCLQVDRRTSSSCWSGGTCPMSTSRQADIILMLEWRDMSNVYKWTGGHHPHAGVEGHVQCLQVDRRTSSSCWSGGTCPMSTSRQAGIILMLEWRDMSNVYKWTGGHHPHAGVEGHVQCLQVDRRTSSSCWSGGTCPMSTSRQADIILISSKCHLFSS